MSIFPEGLKSQKVELTPEQKSAKFWTILSLVVMISASIWVDQFTKYRSQDHLMTWQSEEDIRQYKGKLYPIFSLGTENARENGPYLAMNFSYVRNTGAAWGFMSGLEDSVRVPFFYAITAFAIFLIIRFIQMTPLSHRLQRFALALILSGAFGNFIDRVVLNFVIDWIDVRWNFFGWYYAFPNFNFADSAISVGAFFFLIDLLFLERKRREDALKKFGIKDETVKSSGAASEA